MNKKEIFGWTMYDWANSAFATTVMAAVLPIYYQTVAGANLKPSTAVSYWGYTQSIALLIVAVLAPILGAIADYSGAKKKFLLFFASIGMISSLFLVFINEGDYLLASLLVILGTIGFSGGNAFYDAFLPEIAPREELDRISSRGYALGYVGGGLLLVINLAMILKPHLFGLPNKTVATQLSLCSVGVWWFIFSIPLIKYLKERPSHIKKQKGPIVLIGLKRVKHTFVEIKKFPELFKFLIAFWLYNDGISTIIKMATIYGSQIGIGTNDLIAALVITQFVGIPFSFLFGRLAKRFKAKNALYGALIIYTLIVLLGYFMTTSLQFYILATMVGLVQGGAQALSRSLYGSMVPKNRHAEFFGFYGIFGKFSAILGPLVFALVGQITGSSRLGIFSLILFFLIGIILLYRVNIQKGLEEADQ